MSGGRSQKKVEADKSKGEEKRAEQDKGKDKARKDKGKLV